MFKFILKMLVMPVVLLITIIVFLFDKVAKVYCFAASILYKLLALGALLAVVSKQWMALGIFAGIFVLSLAVLFGSGWVMVNLECLKMRLCQK